MPKFHQRASAVHNAPIGRVENGETETTCPGAQLSLESKPAGSAIGPLSKRKRRRQKVQNKRNELLTKLEAQQPSKLKPSHKKSKGGMMMDVETAETATTDTSTSLLPLMTSLANDVLNGGGTTKAELNNKQRKKTTANREMRQFDAVSQHPVFQANPLDTILEHVQNSVRIQREEELSARAEAAEVEKTLRKATRQNQSRTRIKTQNKNKKK